MAIDSALAAAGSQPVAQTDAMGGAGSIAKGLQSLVVNGVSRASDGFLSTKFPLTSFNEPLSAEGAGAFEPGGNITPRSAPGKTPSGTAPIVQSPVSLLQNPIVYGLAAIAIVIIAVRLAR